MLANLGGLNLRQGHVEDARRRYQHALDNARAMSDRRFEGIVLGNLASLLARVGTHHASRDAFAAGGRILRDVGDPLELAKLLCARAEADRAAGDVTGARAALEEAAALAAAVGVGPASALGRAVASLRGALGGSAP